MFQLKKSLASILCACAAVSMATIFVAGAPSAYAQVTTSSIHGTVTDSSGAVVADAKVTALNTSTGIAVDTTTNHSGYYLFTSLQPGSPYNDHCRGQWIRHATRTKGITLIVNANWDADAKLQVGASQQSVTVDATALQVETSNTQLEQVATADQIEGIPLAGRDASGLQKLEPGVVESSDRFGNFSSNGNQTPEQLPCQRSRHQRRSSPE